MTSNNSQFSVSWDSYQNNVCSGFSSFQQNGEFVDMTIAADGHLVKVHQVLMALSSPYLKEIIRATPNNQHPVIFLNNVDYNTLCSLLEYIYTGEVVVPVDNFSTFLDTGRALHIKGLENVMDTRKKAPAKTQRELITSGLKPIVVNPSAASDKVAFGNRPFNLDQVSTNVGALPALKDDNDFHLGEDYTHDDDDHDDSIGITPPPPVKKFAGRIEANVQFTVSTRGSLQMILNRYLYNVTSKSNKTTMRRWRCVDYRQLRCPAYVVTKGSVVVNRGHPHNHSFHDKKILSKLENKAVYSAIDDVAGVTAAQEYNEAIEGDDTMEEDQIITS